MALNYTKAGVDVEAGDALVDWLQKENQRDSQSQSPFQDKMVSTIGGFAAITRFQFPELKKPCIVTSTDGVGTKVKLASYFQSYQGVGQDLVAMCVNDLITCGAQPFLFLDYYATGKLDLKAAREFLTGIRAACLESGCALVGGETAEMPGVYHSNDFDCAGFAIGVVDEDEILGSHRVKPGDRVMAVSSSGFHSNGYSLLRKVFENDLEKWKDILLTPTHLYVKMALELKSKNLVHAMANVTGGGIENLPRVLPKGSTFHLTPWSWPAPFHEVQRRTQMSDKEMIRTLNCGVGFALVVAPENWQAAEKVVGANGFQAWELGRLEFSDALSREAQLDDSQIQSGSNI